MTRILLFTSIVTIFLFETPLLRAEASSTLRQPSPQTIKQFFSSHPLVPNNKAASHTFVFFVNGAADHLVPSSSEASNTSLSRVDLAEVKRIQALAEECRQCNVILLHFQPQQAARPHGMEALTSSTLLGVYRSGKLLFERRLAALNAADPLVLTKLLQFSEESFPASRTHLIYRGHSFTYLGEGEATPFDANFPDSPYSMATFIKSLEAAHLARPLATVTFAACSMANTRLASSLTAYAGYMIASQVDILQTLDSGFSYRFLRHITGKSSDKDIALTIASTLLERIKQQKNPRDYMMEHPVSLVELSALPSLQEDLQAICRSIDHDDHTFFNRHKQAIYQASGIAKYLSDEFIAYKKQQGLTPAKIAKWIASIKTPNGVQGEVDTIGFLRYLAKQDLPSSVLFQINRCLQSLETSLTVFDNPAHANKYGLSFRSPFLN